MKKIVLLLFFFSVMIFGFCQEKTNSKNNHENVTKIQEILIEKPKINLKEIDQNQYSEQVLKVLKEKAKNSLNIQDIDLVNQQYSTQEYPPEEKKIKNKSVSIGRDEVVFEGDLENKSIGKSESEGAHVLKGPSTYDSRIEAFQLNKEKAWQNKILNISSSVGVIIEKEKVNKISKEYFQIDIQNKLGANFNLCENVPFKDQPVVGNGTAFLIKGNRLISANHVFERAINNYVIVFNFEMINDKTVNNIIHESNVFSLNKVLFKDEEIDVIIFNTNREIKKESLETQRSKGLKKYHKVYSVGYPTGIPKKISVNAEILDNNNLYYFYTSLDAFQGNSGSPVFDLETNKVIGVLVSGQKDFTFNGSCNELSICSYPNCKGEKIVRIEIILDRY